MKLRLISFGKLKTPGLRETLDYYFKLLKPWVPADLIELKPIPVPNRSPATRRQIQKQEIELLKSKLETRSVTYVLDETGKALTTRAWSLLLDEWRGSSIPTIQFCIGSSLGFPKEDLPFPIAGRLCLGPHTLSHDLARVVLMEQIYRAMSILQGHPYHVDG